MTPENPVYLDYNATTPLLPEAADAVMRALADFGNPSSVHAFGRKARAIIETAREAVAAMTGVTPAQVIFTSGGTEANALALKGLAPGRAIVSAAIEHPSVLAHVPEANQVRVTENGLIDLDAFEAKLAAASRPVVATLMLANNETGVIQPVADAMAVARTHGALFHCDAVQAAGKMKLDFEALSIDSLSLSAHKFGGPKGVGALIICRGVGLEPLILGGGQERRKRAGTENVPGIAGFGAAALAVDKLLGETKRIAALRDALENAIMRHCPEARIYGRERTRLCNTLCVGLPGVSAETQLMRLDLAGVAVSAGSACSSGKIAPSHVLTAMGAGAAEAKCAIRISLGWRTTSADIDRFLTAWRPLTAHAAA